MARSELLELFVVCHFGRIAAVSVDKRKVSRHEFAAQLEHVQGKIAEASSRGGDFIVKLSRSRIAEDGAAFAPLPSACFQSIETVELISVSCIHMIEVQLTLFSQLTPHLAQFCPQ